MSIDPNFTVYQYVIQDMQEMSFPRYFISRQYYPNIREARKDWEFEPMFRVRHAYKKSRVAGDTANTLWWHTRLEREKRENEKNSKNK